MYGVLTGMNSPEARQKIMFRLIEQEKALKEQAKKQKKIEAENAERDKFKQYFDFFVCDVIFFYTDGKPHGSSDRVFIDRGTAEDARAIVDVWTNFILGNV